MPFQGESLLKGLLESGGGLLSTKLDWRKGFHK